MRLALIGPSWNHLAEPFAGGQEALVATLTRGLRERGHRVRLYARPGTPADLADELVTFPEVPELSPTAAAEHPDPKDLYDRQAYTVVVSDLIERPDVDLVLNHSFSPLPLAMSRLLPGPVLTTLHTPALPLVELGAASAAPTARFVAVSEATARSWSTLPEVGVVPNGVDPTRFTFGPGGGGLVWVGRITPEKGLPVAIGAARAAGRPLSIIGPVSDPEHYRRDIVPLLGDDVHHLGHLEQAQIRECVAVSCAALVTPRWDEPFGLVAAEAMMCGTPVVALARGGLPEVVGAHGGIVVPDPGEDAAASAALASAVPDALRLDRHTVRADALERLSSTAMIDAYCRVIAEMEPAPPVPVSPLRRDVPRLLRPHTATGRALAT